MKILHIVSSFPRTDNDPEVPWLVEMLKRLKKKKFGIDVLAPSFKGLKTHSIGGINVYRYRYFFKSCEDLTHEHGMPNKIKNPLYFFVFIFYVIFGVIATVRLCKKNNYDAIHVHWPFPHALFGLLAKKVYPAKLILHFYATELLMIKNKFPFLKICIRRWAKKADRIIAISEFSASLLKEMGVQKEIKVLPYGVTIKEKKSAAKKSSKKKILFVGRLIERKGVPYLIKAMPTILKEADAELTIVGGGDKREEWENLAESLNLGGKVIFTGKISEQQLTKLYKECDVFVLPAITDSRGDTEGLGVVLIEAMTYKKPVIASNVGGIVDIIINNKTGLLVPQKDAKALAETITKILKDKKLAIKLGEQGYVYVKKKFNWDTIIGEMLKIYETIK